MVIRSQPGSDHHPRTTRGPLAPDPNPWTLPLAYLPCPCSSALSLLSQLTTSIQTPQSTSAVQSVSYHCLPFFYLSFLSFYPFLNFPALTPALVLLFHTIHHLLPLSTSVAKYVILHHLRVHQPYLFLLLPVPHFPCLFYHIPSLPQLTYQPNHSAVPPYTPVLSLFVLPFLLYHSCFTFLFYGFF